MNVIINLFAFIIIFSTMCKTMYSYLIVDAFPYRGEAIALFRIAYLQDVVNHTILIKTNSTDQSGSSMYKQALQSLNVSGKIIIEKVPLPLNNSHSHSHFRLRFLRDSIRDTVLRLFPAQDFILIVADADEIPRKESIRNLNYSNFLYASHLLMRTLVYSFNWTTSDISSGAFVINSQGLQALTESISDVREEPFNTYNSMEVEAGWRCAHFTSPHLLAKIISSTRGKDLSTLTSSCIEKLPIYFREAGLDLMENSFSENALLIPYTGFSGYPYCETCKGIPGYKYFDIQSSVNKSRVVQTGLVSGSCVPVLGVGVIADPRGFFIRLVKSIDSCVNNFVLVQSSYVNISEGIDLLRANKFIHNVTVVVIDSMIVSCAEGWNIIVGTFPSAPWFAIVAYDVYFLPGELLKFAHRFWDQSGRGRMRHIPNCLYETKGGLNFIIQPVRLLAFSGWVTMTDGGRYNFFAMDSALVEAAGTFDENFYPAEFEDAEWDIRIKRVSGVVVQTFDEVQFHHGLGDYDPNVKYVRKGTNYKSSLIHLNGAIKDYTAFKADGSWQSKAYLMQKWGCTRVLRCTFKRPFNNASLPVTYWKKDILRIKELLNKFGMNHAI